MSNVFKMSKKTQKETTRKSGCSLYSNFLKWLSLSLMHTNLLVVTELVVSRTHCKSFLRQLKYALLNETTSILIAVGATLHYWECSRKFVQIRKCKTEQKSQSTDDQNRCSASDVRSLLVIAITKATSQSANWMGKAWFHLTFLHRFSRRFKMGWMHSFCAVYAWRLQCVKKIKGGPDKKRAKKRNVWTRPNVVVYPFLWRCWRYWIYDVAFSVNGP